MTRLARLLSAALLTGGIAAAADEAQSTSPPRPPAAETDAWRARELDGLFANLKKVTSEDDADAIVAQIWQLWLYSGRPELDATMQRAIGLMGAGLAALALPVLDEIVAKAPDWAEGWNKRATVHFLMGEHDRSLADIERTLALEPRHFGALAGVGLIRIQKDEPRAALAAYRRALAVNPFLKERLQLIPQLEREVGERPL